MKSASALAGTRDILRRIAEAPRVLWCIDFDGTLVPIAPRPDLVVLDGEGRAALRALSVRRGHRVAVVSGRPLRFVQRQIGVKGVFCAGNHGLEIEGPGLSFRHRAAVSARPSLAAVKGAWKVLASRFHGALVEDKGLSVTFHYRQVRRAGQEEARAAALEAGRSAALPGRLRLTEGKKVVEARPPVKWGKGEALGRLARHWRWRPGHGLVVALGDDETDRDMFRVVGRGGVAVFVGRRTPPPEATARLTGPVAVRNLLRRAAGMPWGPPATSR